MNILTDCGGLTASPNIHDLKEIDEENSLSNQYGIGNIEVQTDDFVNHDNDSESEDEERKNEVVENQEVADKGLLPSDVVMAMLTICGDLCCTKYGTMWIHEENGDF